MSWYWSDRTDNGKIQSDGTPVTTYPITVSVWANWLTNDSDNDDCIFQIENNASSSELMRLGLSDGAGNDTLNTYFGGDNIQTSNEMSAGTWHHCLHQWISSTSRLARLDGTEVSDTNTISHTGYNQMTIGREGDSTPSDSWQGRIAEVAVWDVELNDQEKVMLEAGYSPLCLTHRLGNLVVYEPLDSPVLNRYLIHANAPTFTAGADSGGTAPVYDSDHPIIIRPVSQEIYSPPAQFKLITLEEQGLSTGAPHTGTVVQPNEGDLLVVALQYNHVDGASIDSGEGTEWNEIFNGDPGSSGDTANLCVYWKIAGDSEPTQYNFTGNAGNQRYTTLYRAYQTAIPAVLDRVLVDDNDVTSSSGMICSAGDGFKVAPYGIGIAFVQKDGAMGTEEYTDADNSHGNVQSANVSVGGLSAACDRIDQSGLGFTVSGDIRIDVADNDDGLNNSCTNVYVSFVLPYFHNVIPGILDGLDSDLSEGTGWDALVKPIDPSNVTRVSDTRVTVDLPALATFDITALETITSTVESKALQSSINDIVGSPTFTVDVDVGGGQSIVPLVVNAHNHFGGGLK